MNLVRENGSARKDHRLVLLCLFGAGVVAFGVSLQANALLLSLVFRFAVGAIGAILSLAPRRLASPERRFFVSYLIFYLGFFCNAAVLAANNGTMPVGADYGPVNGPLHVPLTAHSNLIILADILPGGSSIGDWIMGVGLILIYFFLVASLVRRSNANG